MSAIVAMNGVSEVERTGYRDDIEDLYIRFHGDATGVLDLIVWHSVATRRSRVFFGEANFPASDDDVIAVTDAICRRAFDVVDQDLRITNLTGRVRTFVFGY